MKKLHPALFRRVILLLLREYLLQRDSSLAVHVEQVVEATRSDSPQWDLTLPQELQIQRRYDTFAIVRLSSSTGRSMIPIPDEGAIEIPELGATLRIQRMEVPVDYASLFQSQDVLTGHVVYLNADKVRGELVLRPRRPGDRYQPLGLQGAKKVKKMMIEARLTYEQRAQPRVLTAGNDILWVIGCPINDDYKIGPDTRNMLRVQFPCLDR